MYRKPLPATTEPASGGGVFVRQKQGILPTPLDGRVGAGHHFGCGRSRASKRSGDDIKTHGRVRQAADKCDLEKNFKILINLDTSESCSFQEGMNALTAICSFAAEVGRGERCACCGGQNLTEEFDALDSRRQTPQREGGARKDVRSSNRRCHARRGRESHGPLQEDQDRSEIRRAGAEAASAFAAASSSSLSGQFRTQQRKCQLDMSKLFEEVAAIVKVDSRG